MRPEPFEESIRLRVSLISLPPIRRIYAPGAVAESAFLASCCRPDPVIRICSLLLTIGRVLQSVANQREALTKPDCAVLKEVRNDGSNFEAHRIRHGRL